MSPHLHVLALDGVHTARTESGGAPICFHALPPPETGEVAELLRVVVRRTLAALVRTGRLRKSEEGYEVVSREELREAEPGSALEACQRASVAGRVGPRKRLRWPCRQRATVRESRCGEMTDALIRIKRAVMAGRYDFSIKATDEMEADGLTPRDVAESILTAVAVFKRLRSRSRWRGQRIEYLYVIQSTNLEGLMVYTKGKLVTEAAEDRYYFLVSAKRVL